jgi:hypothetical protein
MYGQDRTSRRENMTSRTVSPVPIATSVPLTLDSSLFRPERTADISPIPTARLAGVAKDDVVAMELEDSSGSIA